MRVTHVIFNFRTGGTENMLIDIMRQQLEQGAEVSMVIINGNNEPALVDAIPPGVRRVMIGRPEGSRNPWYILKYNLALRHLRPDVIHIHTVKAAGMIIGRPAPLGLTVHCCDAQLSYLDRYSRVWAISQAVSDDIRDRYGIASTVVYNGIDTSAVAVNPHHTHSPQPLKILQIGRLEPRIKGQDLMLHALAELRQRPEMPQVRLTFIGDGSGREHLQAMARQLGVAGDVTFAGNLSRRQLYPRLCEYDLLIQPSRNEGFGLTVAEGMAAAIPVACSTLSGIMEVTDSGHYATAFKPESATAIDEAIADVAANYPQKLALAQTDALRWVRTHFDIAATAAHYLDQYRQIK